MKLNGNLQPSQDVADVKITPDSSKVIYKIEEWLQDWDELYSVSLTGGASVKRNDPLVPGGGVNSYKISPFSSRLLYTADQDIDEKMELYEPIISLW